MVRSYNFIYTKLVKSESDFLGQISYSLYKQDKISHIKEYIKEKGVDIEEVELDKFHQMTNKDIMIEAYRRKAQENLEGFVSDTLKETIEDIKASIIGGQAEILKDIIKPITPASKTKQFWIRILQSILANLTVSAIFALIVLILYVAKAGFLRTIEDIYNVKFSPDRISGR